MCDFLIWVACLFSWLTLKETWTSPSSTWHRACCSTAVRLWPGLWRRTPATAPTSRWPATVEGLWCWCRTSANSSSCVWFKSRCCACCHSPSCSVFFSWGATWWSNRRAWLTSWWRTGDPPKTWRRWWSDSARARRVGTAEDLERSFGARSASACISPRRPPCCPSEGIYAKTSHFLQQQKKGYSSQRPMFMRKVCA